MKIEVTKQTQIETAKYFTDKINKAGLAELYVLEKRLERHYNAGTLTVSSFARLDARAMEEIARFDCLD